MSDYPEKAWKNHWIAWLWKAWLAIFSFSVLMIGVFFGIFEEKTLSSATWKALFAEHSWPLWYFVISILVTLVFVSGIFVAITKLLDDQRISEADKKINLLKCAKESYERKIHEKTIELENLKVVFRDRERMRMLDHVTGIPNFESWEEDLQNWASKGSNRNEFSLILIDLDNLKWLNERSRDAADLVLRFFARNTYDSMRRNEQLYKAPDKNLSHEDEYRQEELSTTSKMYRHYQGGDEFFFIISGDVYDAVGFANRLVVDIVKYTKKIHDEILIKFMDKSDAQDFHLSFSATIAPIHPGTNPQTALSNAYRLLDRSKKSDPRLLVVFDDSYEHLAIRRAKLEKEKEVEAELQIGKNREGKSPKPIEEFDRKIKILKQGEQLFRAQEYHKKPRNL